MSLTERQKREQSYYNQFAEMFTLNENIDFSPILGKERRPWNSYWYIYQLAEEAAAGKVSPKLLDFGSGPGENALRFAKLGYEVEGFDISEKISRPQVGFLKSTKFREISKFLLR